MDNTKELYKIFKKRNFYTLKDSANIFFYALLVPLLVSFLFVIISMSIISSQITESKDAQTILENSLWFLIIATIITQVVFICIYFIYNKVNRISQRSCNLSFKKANIWTSLLFCFMGILFVIGFVWLINGCFGEMFRRLGLQESTMSIPLDNVGWLFVNFLLLGIVPAVSEELLFRGVIYQGLREKYSILTSVLLNGLFFALIHQNIQQFIYPFILGCVLSLIMERTNNLLYPILLHLFNNLTTILMQYLTNIGVLNISMHITWWFVLIAILVAGVTGVIFYLIDRFYLKKHNKIEIQKEGECIQTPPLAVNGFPVSFIIAIVVAVSLIVINAIG